MAYCCEEDESQFFDAHDDIIALSNSGSDYPLSDISYSGEDICNWASSASQFKFWIQNPLSVEERRSKFFNWLDLSANRVSDAKVDRIRSCNGAVLCSTWSGNGLEYCEDSIGMENLMCKTGNWENGDCIRDDDREDDLCGGIGELDSDMPCVIPSREDFVAEKSSLSNLGSSRKSEKKWWFRKLRSLSCVMEEKQKQIEGSNSFGKRPQRVKVRQCSKKHKEMSALYLSQDFQAHEGSIIVMKFSPDGEFLASAGEDRIVRVWKVVVDERSNAIDIPDIDPLSLYFTLNHQLELLPFYAKKERTCKVKRWSRTSDSACVVLPPKVFRLLEKPLCEFKGHRGEILDLSWSNSNGCLVGLITGLRGGGNYISSSFTPNGKYIISACEDSNVYIWNCADHDHHDPSHAKKIRSFERFPCTASLAVSWNGFQNVNTSPFGLPNNRTKNAHHLPSPALFSLDQEFFLESNYPKGSQTWPEESLPSAQPGSVSSMHRSEYKFLRACQSISSPNTWGLVILTAGWDGRIKSFHNYGLPNLYGMYFVAVAQRRTRIMCLGEDQYSLSLT
ncbi:hypothetical protein V2J09_016603 [Rumex salicifolius]